MLASAFRFGLQIPLLPTTSDSLRLVNKYLYNGKELQPQTGLLDYGARQYDAAVGRWFGVDPLAEKYYFISPYAYVANMSLRAVDSDGRKIIFVIRNENVSRTLAYKDGNFYWDDTKKV